MTLCILMEMVSTQSKTQILNHSYIIYVYPEQESILKIIKEIIKT